MAELKLTISHKEKTYSKTLEKNIFIGQKLGDTISGDQIGLKGYELKITGGSDDAGFPMRSDIMGIGRKRPLLTKGPGIHLKRKGMQKRKTIVGNTVSMATAQLNLTVIKPGSKNLQDLLGTKKEEVKKEEKKEEPKKEEKK